MSDPTSPTNPLELIFNWCAIFAGSTFAVAGYVFAVQWMTGYPVQKVVAALAEAAVNYITTGKVL